MNIIIIKHALKLAWASLTITTLVSGVTQDNYMPLLIVLGVWALIKIIVEAIVAIKYFKGARRQVVSPQEPSRETMFWQQDPDLW